MAKAERLVGEEWARRGWEAGELGRRKKGDREKIRVAARLRRETTMTWDWIAERLQMGAGAFAANCVRAVG